MNIIKLLPFAAMLSMLACSSPSPPSNVGIKKYTLSYNTISQDSTYDEYAEESVYEIMHSMIDTQELSLRLHPEKSYYEGLNYIKLKKHQLMQQYQQATSQKIKDSILVVAGKFVEEQLLNHVFPSWYGTAWAYEGHTDTPQVGEVACGYFVTTTLKHIDFKLNRYKLAQQTGSTGCKTLAIGDKIHKLHGVHTNDIYTYFNKHMEEGLYHVALAYHVGFLLYRNDQLLFIHSNFADPGGVIIEPIDESLGFESNIYLFNGISTNKKLIRKWLMEETIEIQKT